jgi:hypothetical protein
VEWICQNRGKSTILGHFWGFCGFSHMENMEKKYILEISCNHQDKQLLFNEYFPEMLILGDSQLG